MENCIVPIIDTGHGYNTPGKRSKFHYTKDSKVVMKENSFNEAVGNKLSYIFHSNNKPYSFISNEWYDISLDERVDRETSQTNLYQLQGFTPIFISIHADAYGSTKEQGEKADGATFFYYTEVGRKVAEHFTKVFQDNNYPIRMRSPKKGNFKVLRDTVSPAILFEAGFMTNSRDLDKLKSDYTRNKAAELLYKSIITLDL